MLMFAGIIASICAVCVFLLNAFAEGMSTAPSSSRMWSRQWPAGLIAVFAVACFVVRHFLHGHAITW